MTRTVMLEPALLDAKYEAPRQILGAPWPGIDGPMLAAIILSANHGLAEGENDRAMIAGFGRAHFAHDRARRGGGDVASADRKSVVVGTSVSVRVDLGGRLIIKKKKKADRCEKCTYNR